MGKKNTVLTRTVCGLHQVINNLTLKSEISPLILRFIPDFSTPLSDFDTFLVTVLHLLSLVIVMVTRVITKLIYSV